MLLACILVSLANLSAAAPDYSRLLELSLLFYEAQRSGYLPPTNRIPWRGDSGLQDTGHNGEDLSGGYYDASDFVKFGMTQAFAMTVMSWGVLTDQGGYDKAVQRHYALEALEWGAVYFIKCHVGPQELYGQVGDFKLDHMFWGRPEELNMSRPGFLINSSKPASDLAGEVAASLAAMSMVFREQYTTLTLNKTKEHNHNCPHRQHREQPADPPSNSIQQEDMKMALHWLELANDCVRHSEEIFKLAVEHRGLVQDAMPVLKPYFMSTGYGDELAWAAIWLHKATNSKLYLDQALAFYKEFNLDLTPTTFSRNDKTAGVQVLLAQITKSPMYTADALAFCDYAMNGLARTPAGLVYVEKEGTLCHAANIAFVCLQAADLSPRREEYIQFSRQQIGYMLGDSGRSYVVGFGQNPPQQPHHAASSCPSRPDSCGWEQLNFTGPNPQILWGALVSGPDRNDYFQDLREEYIYTEVTLECNAGLQGAAAILLGLDEQRNEVEGGRSDCKGRETSYETQ